MSRTTPPAAAARLSSPTGARAEILYSTGTRTRRPRRTARRPRPASPPGNAWNRQRPAASSSLRASSSATASKTASSRSTGQPQQQASAPQPENNWNELTAGNGGFNGSNGAASGRSSRSGGLASSSRSLPSIPASPPTVPVQPSSASASTSTSSLTASYTAAAAAAAAAGIKPPPIPSSGSSSSLAADAREKQLLAQIKELTRQLDKEKHRKKESARAAQTSKELRRRLIICSQLLPYHMSRLEDGTVVIGEASTKQKAYESLQDRLDVAWVGCPAVHVPEEQQEDIRTQFLALSCHVVFIEEAEMELAEGMWAEVLWPLFHYIPLSMLESDTEMIHQRWCAYEKLNRSIATVAIGVTLPTDLVLVHDYHLMLLPAALREKQPKVKIGWFLHTPFPSAEIYVTLPLRKELLRGVLAADLIAFHTFDYVRHFMNSCSRVLGTDISVESNYILDSSKRTAVTVDAFPTGIDTALFLDMINSTQLKDKVIELQRRFDGKSLVLGIDRMDYVKGIPHKLIALEVLTRVPWMGE